MKVDPLTKSGLERSFLATRWPTTLFNAKNSTLGPLEFTYVPIYIVFSIVVCSNDISKQNSASPFQHLNNKSSKILFFKFFSILTNFLFSFSTPIAHWLS